MSIGGNLRRLRTEAGLRQQELADRAGLTQGQISRFENGVGRVDVEHLAKLAKALACDVGDLDERCAATPKEAPVAAEEGDEMLRFVIDSWNSLDVCTRAAIAGMTATALERQAAGKGEGAGESAGRPR